MRIFDNSNRMNRARKLMLEGKKHQRSRRDLFEEEKQPKTHRDIDEQYFQMEWRRTRNENDSSCNEVHHTKSKKVSRCSRRHSMVGTHDFAQQKKPAQSRRGSMNGVKYCGNSGSSHSTKSTFFERVISFEDAEQIQKIQEYWQTIKPGILKDFVFGEKLIRKMIELEPSAQWVMRLETLEVSASNERYSYLCKKLVSILEDTFALLSPTIEYDDLSVQRTQLRREGVDAELLSEVLPVCVNFALIRGGDEGVPRAEQRQFRKAMHKILS